MERMSSAPTADEIARDATWLVQALDPSQGAARLVAMDPDSYRAASFLDDRLLQSPVDAQIVAWTDIEAAVTDDMRSDARWIFHIGHVGSTLVSRLLGDLDDVLAIREPRLLRDLALTPADIRHRYIAPIPKLMSRTFSDSEVACVKATSFASEIAPELVPPNERALFMYATPRNYIASILAGENSIEELRLLAGKRAQRLNARGIYVPAQNDAGHAAAAWATEMTALEVASDAMSDRKIKWVDFDSMLADMELALVQIGSFFRFTFQAEAMQEIVRGPLMSRYSKAVEYEYSPNLRRELIGEAAERHSADIATALAMLRSAAEKSPLLARALRRSEEG
ncbi:MAG TPA: hypothetical protein VE820_06010 [Sphingomicrobium sp.]|jgi:hypothetical protein|nr:hypothetical protein [Sphingomicrobium sp.]